jgi:hypothetical protein
LFFSNPIRHSSLSLNGQLICAVFLVFLSLFTSSTRFSFSPSSFLAQFHFSSNDEKVPRASTRLVLSVLQTKKKKDCVTKGPRHSLHFIMIENQPSTLLRRWRSFFISRLFSMGSLYLGQKGHALVCRLMVFQTKPASWAARFSFFRSLTCLAHQKKKSIKQV